MTKFIILSTFTALLCASIGHVNTRAVVPRDVINPPITYPTAGTQWNVGDRHNVTWDTSVIPPGFSSNGSLLVLGYLDNGGDNEHLDLDHPLAKGFSITDGRAEITVPSVTTRDSYILVLFGDSGNTSGKFTIKNITIDATSSAASGATSSGTSSSGPPSSSQYSSSVSDNGQGASPTSSGDTTSAPATYSQNWGSRSGAGFGTVTNNFDMTITSSPAAQTAPVPQPTNPAYGNTGFRTASFCRPAAWISTICSLGMVLGWAL